MADWQAIKTEYITTDTSYRKLADKYGVSRVQIGNVGRDEGWVELRRQHLANTLTKTLNAAADQSAQRYTRIMEATDRLLDKIERAIDELDITLATDVKKTKTIEYNNAHRPDKPTREVVDEVTTIRQTVTIIDRGGLKAISSALKDLKEIQMLRTALDEQEQEARIANLRRQADKDNETKQPTLVVEGLPEEFKV